MAPDPQVNDAHAVRIAPKRPVAGARFGAGADPLTELTAGNLAEIYARLRREAPVHWSARLGGWVLTRYADAVAVLADPSYLADDPVSRFALLESRGGPSLGNLRVLLSNVSFFTDPPLHIKLRKFMGRLLQASEVAPIRGTLEQRATDILARGRDAGRLDLAFEYGRDLAVFTISSVLGLPVDDCFEQAARARDVAWVFDLTPRSLKDLRRAEQRGGELLDYFEEQIVRAREAEQSGRFARLVARSDADLGLSDRELAGLVTFVFSGGQESTAAGIPAAVVMLLKNDELRARLTADPTQVPAAAREFLRLAAPFQYVARIASRDGVIGGTDIRRGDRVTIVLGAACRDPADFPGPDTIDIDRAGSESLAFGYGAYRCLGAALAQTETEVALAAILDHPDLRLAPEGIEWETRTRMPAMARAWAEFV